MTKNELRKVRDELLDYVETGRLRDDVAHGLSEEAQDRLVELVRRDSIPRTPRR